MRKSVPKSLRGKRTMPSPRAKSVPTARAPPKTGPRGRSQRPARTHATRKTIWVPMSACQYGTSYPNGVGPPVNTIGSKATLTAGRTAPKRRFMAARRTGFRRGPSDAGPGSPWAFSVVTFGNRVFRCERSRTRPAKDGESAVREWRRGLSSSREEIGQRLDRVRDGDPSPESSAIGAARMASSAARTVPTESPPKTGVMVDAATPGQAAKRPRGLSASHAGA